MLHQTFLFLGQLWQLFEVSQILEFLRYPHLARVKRTAKNGRTGLQPVCFGFLYSFDSYINGRIYRINKDLTRFDLFWIMSIGVGRFTILWGPRFRILGGPNSQQAHDVVMTSMRRNGVASTSFRRHVPNRFLINRCQIFTFLILKYDIIENSRIELRGIVLPVQVFGLLGGGGGGKGYVGPPLKLLGGGPGPPWPPLFLRL